MRTAFVRRILSASAVSLALLATACGASDKADPKGDAKPSVSAPASASAPAARGKQEAELAGLILTQADLPDHVVKPATPEEVQEGAKVTTDKPACLPVAQAQSMAAIGAPVGVARVKFIAKGKDAGPNATAEEKAKAAVDALGGTVTSVALASYDGAGAEEAFATFKKAAAICASGYEIATQGEEPGKVTKVDPSSPIAARDEAVAYTVKLEGEGETVLTELVVVRKGNSLVSFYSLSITGNAEQPRAAVAAQVKKLS